MRMHFAHFRGNKCKKKLCIYFEGQTKMTYGPNLLHATCFCNDIIVYALTYFDSFSQCFKNSLHEVEETTASNCKILYLSNFYHQNIARLFCNPLHECLYWKSVCYNFWCVVWWNIQQSWYTVVIITPPPPYRNPRLWIEMFFLLAKVIIFLPPPYTNLDF